jgi:hypothetical protein
MQQWARGRVQKENPSSARGDAAIANELRKQTRNRFTRASDQRGNVCMGKAYVDQRTLGCLSPVLCSEACEQLHEPILNL